MLTYEVSAGEHIGRAVGNAGAIAGQSLEPVAFKFNGVDVVVNPEDSAAIVIARWEAENARQAEAYRNSPARRRAARLDEQDRVGKQLRVDTLLGWLPWKAKELSTLIPWLVDYADASDRVDVRGHRDTVLEVLYDAGYVEDAHVGNPPEAFEGNRKMAGEYIVGQCINCMRMGMTPHPVVARFAREAGFLEEA